MSILVLVCALGVSAHDCRVETAVHKFHVPIAQRDAGVCLREGLMYAVQSGLVPEGTYPKVICGPPRRIARRRTD